MSLDACPIPHTFAEIELLQEAGFFEEPSKDCLPATLLLARAVGGVHTYSKGYVEPSVFRIQALANVLTVARESGNVDESDALTVLDTIASFARFMRDCDSRRHAEGATLVRPEFVARARELATKWGSHPANFKMVRRLELLLHITEQASP